MLTLSRWLPAHYLCRYAYSALADGPDDEAEEPMMSDAFGTFRLHSQQKENVRVLRIVTFAIASKQRMVTFTSIRPGPL